MDVICVTGALPAHGVAGALGTTDARPARAVNGSIPDADPAPAAALRVGHSTS
jgi:hypothetical protein